VTFEDLGSLNGTFRRIDAPVTLSPGAEFRVGSQSFQLTESRTEKKTKGIHLSSASIKIPPAAPVPAPQPQPAAPAPPPPAEAAPAAPAPPAAPAEAAPAAGPALEGNNVRFTKSGQVVPFTPGQTLLEIAAGADLSGRLAESLPEVNLAVDALGEKSQNAKRELNRWLQRADAAELQRTVRTYFGEQSLHQVLERCVWHSAQHARQLMMVLELLQLEVDAPLTSADFEGLPMPESVWDG